MTPTRPAVTDFGGDHDRPLLVLGPSLGTTAAALWEAAAAELTGRFHVVGFDLPGHGGSEPAPQPTMPGLARDVVRAVDDAGAEGSTFHYAGDSIGGAIGLQLLLDAPERVRSAGLLCTGARIGTTAQWRDRARTVRHHGTEALLETAPARWFGPGFRTAQPRRAQALLDSLRATDDHSYAALCEALATFDVRSRLAGIAAPLLAVAGSHDAATPTSGLRHLAEGVPRGRLVELDGVGHLAPAERPREVAALLADHATAPAAADPTTGAVRAAGMRVRREVLGDAHVDRASAAATDFTTDFQQLITQYAWGGVWTRPGLARRDRSLITLTALVARGHHEELALHVRAARANGLTADEIKELLLQTAVYCGVPDANTGFRIAQRVLDDMAEPATPQPPPEQES
ncbi:4-carboxymuconolactone decarboxylase [Streptomyces sp. TR02-1]|uniref:bifunctional 3-oxoadipate enol-lactonase/4-carboxymuconolactone decarboxylase PcaDC n=1 Tax=Streptomyces sp. TR02-1 TaxID=3385977 RepID=UPI0039A1D929